MKISEHSMELRAVRFLTGITAFTCVWAYTAACLAESQNVVSEQVSLGQGNYRLSSVNGTQLRLEHESGDRRIQHPISIELLKSDELRQNIPWPKGASDRITEIALSRWSGASLCACIKFKHEGETTFWSVTFDFKSLDLNEFQKEERTIGGYTSFIGRGGTQDKILALSGTRASSSITVVYGQVSLTRPGAIDRGAIMFHGCPNPGPANAMVGAFIPKYKDEANDVDDQDIRNK